MKIEFSLLLFYNYFLAICEIMCEYISFSVLLNSLTPLRGDLFNFDALYDEFNSVCGHPIINPILNLVEDKLSKLKVDLESAKDMMVENIDKIL